MGLARAYGLTGDAAKARAAYQDFFALWKDADPDIPILKQAKAEYAKLQKVVYKRSADSCVSLVAVEAFGGDFDLINATEGE